MVNIMNDNINKIVKIKKIDNLKTGKYTISINKIRKIDNGIELYLKAFKYTRRIGFGKQGKIETERIKIINPPVFIDSTNWDKEFISSHKRLKIEDHRYLIEDPKQALIDTILRVIKIIGKNDKKIISGSIGNTTTVVYSNAGGDGGVYAGGDTWSNIRGAASGTNEASETTGACYSEDSGDVWMERVFLPFDTSSLPDTDTISSATIQLYGTGKWDNDNDSEAYVAIVQSTQASPTSLADGDFDAIGTTAFSDELDISSYNTSGFNTFTLNSSGIANISKTGYSQFALREGHDLENIPVAGGAGISGVTNRMADYTGTTSDPILTIVHAADAGADGQFMTTNRHMW